MATRSQACYLALIASFLGVSRIALAANRADQTGHTAPARAAKHPTGNGSNVQPPWASRYWNSVQEHLGEIALDGTLRCRMPLGESPELRSLGFNLILEHGIEINAFGRAQTIWRVPALTTFVTPMGREKLKWQMPGGKIILLERSKIGRSLALFAPDRWLVREDATGAIDIRTEAGRAWRYVHGLIASMEHPALGSLRVSVQGGLVREVRAANDPVQPALLQVDYDRCGRLVRCCCGGGVGHLFVWNADGQLIEWKRANATTIRFSYRDGLLAEIMEDGKQAQRFSWTENPGWRRGDSRWVAPVHLCSDGAHEYSYDLTKLGFIIGTQETSTGRRAITTFNPLRQRLEQKLPGEVPLIVILHRNADGNVAGLEKVMHGNRDVLEEYRYDERDRIVSVLRTGKPAQALAYDDTGRLIEISDITLP